MKSYMRVRHLELYGSIKARTGILIIVYYYFYIVLRMLRWRNHRSTGRVELPYIYILASDSDLEHIYVFNVDNYDTQ